MFLKIADLDGDSRRDVIVTTRNGHLDVYFRKPGGPVAWRSHEIALPSGLPHGKSLSITDVDGDKTMDIVTTNRGEGKVRCVAWQRWSEARDDWLATDIGGFEGEKFDLIEPLDLDGDGDLDLVTCEEAENLGVVWYENPRIAK